MKKRMVAILSVALATCGFVGVSSASAATEFGNTCAGNAQAANHDASEAGFAVVGIANDTSDPLPVAAPTSGVITQWTMDLDAPATSPEEQSENLAQLHQALLVLRPSGEGHYTVVGRSDMVGTLTFAGVNVESARIPVAKGDLLGLAASALICDGTVPDDSAEFLEQRTDPLVGAQVTGIGANGASSLPVVAKIEPDVDGDGFGDETQDACPQSAAFQTPCPLVTISSLPTAGEKAVTLHVSTSVAAPVAVSGTVALPKGEPATLTAAPQTVAPGSLTQFTLPLTKRTKRALKRLPRSKSVTATIVASATNVTGAPSTTTTTVKLRGEAKPVPHHKGHHHKKKTKKKG